MGVPRPAEGWGAQWRGPGDSFLSACLSQQEFCLSGKTESAVISVCVLFHVSLVPGGLEVTS